MAFIIKKVTVDGIEMVGCYQTGSDQETASEGVAEATITAAASDTETTVASPTSSPNVGPSRPGIDYTHRGPMARDAVDGAVYHKRQMLRQRGSLVNFDNYDRRVPRIKLGAGPKNTGM